MTKTRIDKLIMLTVHPEHRQNYGKLTSQQMERIVKFVYDNKESSPEKYELRAREQFKFSNENWILMREIALLCK